MAFFATNGCKVIELTANDDEGKQGKLHHMFLDLERLSKATQAALGKPRNYVGLKPVPYPQDENLGKVNSDIFIMAICL